MNLQAMEPQQMTLISSDQKEIKVSRIYAKKSATIKSLLEDCGFKPVPLTCQACTKQICDVLFSLIDKSPEQIIAVLLKQPFSVVSRVCEAANYLDFETTKIIPQSITILINQIIEEKDSKKLKFYTDIIKHLPLDLKKLAKQELLYKKLIWLRNSFKSMISCTLLEVGHDAFVRSIAFSANDKYALTGSAAKASFFNLDTRKVVLQLQGFGETTKVAINPTSNYALTCGDILINSAFLSMWNLDTGELLKKLDGPNNNIEQVAISADGKKALTGSCDGPLCLWDLEAGKVIKELIGHTDAITAVSVTSDGKRALTGSMDGTAYFWNLETHEIIKKLINPDGRVAVAAISSDGQYALTGPVDGTAYLWNLETGEIIKKLKNHDCGILSLALSPHGKYALLGSRDGIARLWDLCTDEVIEISNDKEKSVHSVAFSNSGTHIMIAAGYNGNRIYYMPLIPEEILNTSLEQLIAVIKLDDIPSILCDTFYKQLLTSIGPKMKEYVESQGQGKN